MSSLISMLGLGGLRYHRVGPADTLTTLSQTFYGTPKYAMVIYQHNRDVLASPNQLPPGVRLCIPHIGATDTVL